ncbi:polyphosphate polymerase domain-containing protein [Adlercreutzia caecimuris]|uniref:polyphosphate polymerase domain-containing protein n=1 Tax=Adlercreutzia caecimuris TaxID=671266 RepID=UPI00257110EF|nr:polyphosphate polymerase domain-containing protein [Adlercreutzia caecimuris]
MAYDSVFKRVEKKYRTTPRQRAAVEAAACDMGAMAVDVYGRTRITSLYLDTPERAMIARSVEKPLYKEKLRLRAYGEAAGTALMAAFGAGPLVRNADRPPLSDAEVEARAAAVPGGEATAVFFGIKKKFKGIVYKRRIALALPAAVAFVSGLPYERACVRWPLADAEQAVAALAPASRQIARELEAAMDRWLPLAPSMGIACDREAWGVRCALAGEPSAAGFAARDTAAARVPAAADGVAPAAAPTFDPALRLTFDDRLSYLDCHGHTSSWQPIVAPDESILEIKSAGPYPPWLVAVLSAQGIYPASFTKYGNAYQRCEGTALQQAVAVS